MKQNCYFKDCGERITVGEIVERVADKLDAGDRSGACDVLDELFIYGSWAFVLEHERTLRADIRGMIIAAYEHGRKRGSKEPKPCQDSLECDDSFYRGTRTPLE